MLGFLNSKRVVLILSVGAFFAVFATNEADGQGIPLMNPLAVDKAEVAIESGRIHHSGLEREVVWTEDIVVEDARWVRLRFDKIVLAGGPRGGVSSTLKITSLKDGKFQLLNAKTAEQWRNSSAYFNGNAVRLELIAAPNGRMNSIAISNVDIAGPSDPLATNEGGARTICDDIDDRQLSDDPRSGRAEPVGCSCWLFNDRNNCLITAGHCADRTDVVMFNVPLSDPNGNRQFPGPEDQYPVDQSSKQFVVNGVGEDWCYFGCFPNSNTGLSAFEAQGQSYTLGTPGPVRPGDEIRITGYGSTSPPVNPSWNSAQKTQLGPYASFSQNALAYRTDTTGGNSGSPIIFEGTGEVIGVHSHGGCGDGGAGSNFGTAITNPDFAAALDNPLGVCVPVIEFTFLTELKEFLNPQGGDTVILTIDQSEFQIIAETATLNLVTETETESIPLTLQSDGTFSAVFPPLECGAIVEYFFRVESTTGDTFTAPERPRMFSAIVATELGKPAFSDDFETNQGWISSGNAITGRWARGVPAGFGDRNDPVDDADGSGRCFVTGNAPGDSDVDSGAAVLTSPVMDARPAKGQESILSYYRWFDSGTSGDAFTVEISNDAGATWVILEQITTEPTDATGGWILRSSRIRDFIEPTDQFRVRFTAADTGIASIVEAAVDAVAIDLVDCDSELLLGDVNGDGAVNLFDVSPFVALLTSGKFQAEADINGDGEVNLFDVSPFVAIVSN